MRLRRTAQIVRIALRHFWRSPLHAALAIAAAMAGTSGVVVCTGFAAGGRQKIFDQFRQMGTNLIVVTPQQSRSVAGRVRTGSLVTTLREVDYRALLTNVPGIAASSPTVSTVMRIRAGDLTKSTTIVGCAPEYFSMLNWDARSGALFTREDARGSRPVVLLGSTAARDLFGDADPTGRPILIGNVPFTSVGVMAERGQGLDAANEDGQVYVPLQTAMHRLMNVEYYGSIVLQVRSWQAMDVTAARIAQVLELRHRFLSVTGPDFEVQNQKALLDTQLEAFRRLTFLLRWIAASTLAVASLGILGVAWIGVGQRVREIGTRRAIGATATDVLTQFFTEGIAGPLLGCGAGIGAAWLVLRAIDARVRQPFLFSVQTVLSAAALSLLLYAGSTLLCCFGAMRVEPSVALKTE
jgi:putative ABC transport system permease protein